PFCVRMELRFETLERMLLATLAKAESTCASEIEMPIRVASSSLIWSSINWSVARCTRLELLAPWPSSRSRLARSLICWSVMGVPLTVTLTLCACTATAISASPTARQSPAVLNASHCLIVFRSLARLFRFVLSHKCGQIPRPEDGLLQSAYHV